MEEKMSLNQRFGIHVVSCSFFVKREKVGKLRFDERLGVGSGTRFGSGEETDFVLNLIGQGAKIVYDGSKCVYHPQSSGAGEISKGWLYGNGYIEMSDGKYCVADPFFAEYLKTDLMFGYA